MVKENSTALISMFACFHVNLVGDAFFSNDNAT